MHAAVTDADYGLRHQPADRLRHLINARDPVVDYEHLASSCELPRDGVPENLLIVRCHICMDRKSVSRRFFYKAYILDARERHIECTGDRGRRKRQHIDAALKFLYFFFMTHAESLLLIDHEESEILESDIIRQQSVRAYHQVYPAAFDSFYRLAKRGLRFESRQFFYLKREFVETLPEIVVMLIDQKCSRREYGCLLALRYAFENSSGSDLRLAVAYISAEEPVHRKRFLHVFLDLFSRS